MEKLSQKLTILTFIDDNKEFTKRYSELLDFKVGSIIKVTNSEDGSCLTSLYRVSNDSEDFDFTFSAEEGDRIIKYYRLFKIS